MGIVVWAATFFKAWRSVGRQGSSIQAGFKWAENYHFALARAELATRLAIAGDICARLRGQGARADRAAAESVMMLELVGESDFWTEVKDRMRVS